MTTRSIQTIEHFSSPFMLPGLDAPQAAGDYRVDHDEEMIEVFSRLAWRRVRAFVHLPALGVEGRIHQMVPITSADLEAALQKDQLTS